MSTSIDSATASSEASSQTFETRRFRAGRRIPHGHRIDVAISLTPSLVVFGTFFVVPAIVLFVTALARWNGVSYSYVGLDNFAAIIHDDTFWKAARNTLLYAAVGVFVQLPLGIVTGMILAQQVRGWQAFRLVLFLPFVISGAAYALVFSMVYNTRYGLLNELLGAVGLPSDHDWLFDSSTALWAVAGTSVLVLGFIVIVVMAECASIDRSLYEAAALDGASTFQTQLHITLPLLRNVIGTLVLITVLGYLALFDVVFIMTGGGPNDATLSLVLYAFRAYTHGAWGYANAVGIVILGLGLLIIVSVRRAFRVGERV